MYQYNIQLLTETLDIFKKHSYKTGGKKIKLKLSNKELYEAQVLLPDKIAEIDTKTFLDKKQSTICGYNCTHDDSYQAAIRMSETLGSEEKVLVLNFANPVNPGGGVRRGARAQEEDLCRKSSLLLSLESEEAKAYYAYNKSLRTYMGSDAVILSPTVEVIRDQHGDLLDDSVIVSVLTCAAPMITNGMEGLTTQQYKDMLFQRIHAILKVAAYYDYKNLILGAWGCGAFGNDAELIADLFYRALEDADENDVCMKGCFEQIEFAVLDHSRSQYNFNCFMDRFGQKQH